MKQNTLTTAVVALLFAAAAFWLVSTSRAATETPEYKVIRSDGKFEIRDYPALTLAGTAMDGSDMNSGFRQLFRFITGTNETSEKIEMTTPVLIGSESGKKTMSFIMPGKTIGKGVPKPSNEKVALGKMEPSRFAVQRFDGGRSTENETKAVARLKEWLEAEKLTAKGEPMFAYYDPPWTPVFMRRNEVMIRIAAPR